MKTKFDQLFFSKTSSFLKDYLPLSIGRSVNTIKSYQDSLTIFRRFINNDLKKSIRDFEFKDCNYDSLNKFKKYLRAKGNSPSTINNKLAAIKSYMHYASVEDASLQSYALRVSYVAFCKVPKKVKPELTKKGIASIFKQPPNTKKGLRNRVIMIMLYATATRLDELLSLTLADVWLNKETPSIMVRGKGNKQRIIGLSKECIPHLKQYISIFHCDNPKKEDYLFYTIINGIRNKISKNTVERFIQQYANKAREKCDEVPLKVYPHLFRSFKATTMYQEGNPLEIVSSFLGHSQLETTLIYAKISQKQLSEAINSIQPEIPLSKKKLWLNKEAELARNFGIR